MAMGPFVIVALVATPFAKLLNPFRLRFD